MAGRGRKIPQHIITMFEKYTPGKSRTLSKELALQMFNSEFGLEGDEAEVMFNTFDKDKNDLLSIWEFQQFCQCMGEHAQEIVAKFREMDTDHSGQLDSEEAREALKQLKTGTGRNLTDREIDFFIDTAGNDGLIDLGHFTNLLYRLKLYNAPPPPPKK
jgi:Ca2+-binding EF-hand superfamily protein